MTSTAQIPKLVEELLLNAYMDRCHSVMYETVAGRNTPPVTSAVVLSGAKFVYLSSAADTTMPVFGKAVALSTPRISPVVTFFLPALRVFRMIFESGTPGTGFLDPSKITISCNGQGKPATTATLYTAMIDVVDPIGCLKDPIVITTTELFVEFVTYAYTTVSDPLGASSVTTVGLPPSYIATLVSAWAASDLFTPANSRSLRVTFDYPISSLNIAGISVSCGASPATISGFAVSDVSFTALLTGCTFNPAT
jgi:hypothetical protein